MTYYMTIENGTVNCYAVTVTGWPRVYPVAEGKPCEAAIDTDSQGNI